VRDLWQFFLLTFALTSAAFFAAGRTEGAAASALILFGTFAPGLVGNATHALLARLFQWRVPSRWSVFALTYVAAIKLLVTLAHRAITGAWPQFGQEPWYVIVGACPASTRRASPFRCTRCR
jgi:hypothetical protein